MLKKNNVIDSIVGEKRGSSRNISCTAERSINNMYLFNKFINPYNVSRHNTVITRTYVTVIMKTLFCAQLYTRYIKVEFDKCMVYCLKLFKIIINIIEIRH